MSNAVRRNVMTIESVDAFISVRGGFRSGVRDVYFTRALGEPGDLAKFISDTDNRLNSASVQKRIAFKRLTVLPPLTERADAEYYTAAYEKLISGRGTGLRKVNEPALADVLKDTISIFRAAKNGANDTIVRNFAVKLLFWADAVLGDLIAQRPDGGCVKLIVSNITGLQEYLFLYAATGLGCDALILNTRADVNADSSVLGLSHSFRLGGYGTGTVPEYKAPQKPVPAPRAQVPEPAPALVPIVLREPVRAAAAFADTKVQRARQEMSYEQLARIASSVVMVTIFDAEGKPQGSGSGIYINSAGYILTNFHVANAGRIFGIMLEEDEKLYVTNQVIKYNPQLDLAIIRVDRQNKAVPLYDGRDKLQRGQKVVAIGSPKGLFNTVSDGIISGFRKIGEKNMIQHTAPTSHGSSGGALLNMYGELIGISTGGIDEAQNISLAVGYEDIRLFAGGLLEPSGR